MRVTLTAVVMASAGFAGSCSNLPPTPPRAAGTSRDGSPGGDAGVDPTVSRSWSWHACGTLSARATPAQLADAGNPETGSPDWFFSLSMSADGTRLASNATGAVLLWAVAPRFEDSVPTYLRFGIPELPDVQVSPDGRWVARMGDGGTVIFSAADGAPVVSTPSAPASLNVCPWPQIRFSPDGRWLAGTDWGSSIAIRSSDEIVAGGAFDIRSELLTSGCDKGASVRVAFSPDGSLLATSTLAFYRTSDWQPIPPIPAGASPQGFGPLEDVKFSPDGRELLVSRYCRDQPDASDGAALSCATLLYSVASGKSIGTLPELTAPFPAYSPEGQWMVAGGVLLHRPSGEVRVFDPVADVAIFAPNGDVIAGDPDLTLTRYCRSQP
jgi:WD40 repeat protein